MAHRMPDQVSRVFRLTSNNDKDCLDNLRMDMSTFARLCYLLHNVGELSDSKYIRVEEKVCFFLSVLAHHKKNVTVKFDHVRSGHTVSIYFNAVLVSLLKPVPILTVTPKPVEDGCTMGCLGALDGTYINVQTPLAHKPRYRNRKGGISVNVLGVVDRNMNFVYMFPGWEGSAADGTVLRDAVSRANGLKVPTGQYYLCDNGYMNSEVSGSVQGCEPHISSKMHAYKKQYNTLYVIFGASGVGWNLTTKMIETDSDEQWEAASKTEPTARAMRWKFWPYSDSWCEILGKDRANGNGAEDFHDAFVGVIHKETETQPQSPTATNLEDIDTPDSPLAEEVSTTPVCELGSSITTKLASKGKHKLSEGIVGPIMEGLNNFTEKTDSRLGDIIGKMGHEHELTRKCESVYHIVNEIPDLTVDDKLVASNMIVKNMQVLAMFFSIPQEAKMGQVRLMLAGKI
ncbi:hypothetical protein BUALT_Bualt11G0061400 [Buddleja alternifolia]|uniref:DDE Tnp4 domain-containing protein n=1 Tax=Buddleja alternifolia TaxID=168488 RepID=A0AAV6X1D8_9LAMI|nr:hypothetical protein BUALT_Bualt11G0061400 [Buddleja alternifolia]